MNSGAYKLRALRRNRAATWLSLLLMTLALCLNHADAADLDARGGQFIGFSSFSGWQKEAGARPRETVLVSPLMVSRIHWNELVASWNAEMQQDTYLKVEARALYAGRASKYYVMGLWSSDPARFPRESVLHQKDDDGEVATDTLSLRQPAQRVQVRVTLGGELKEMPKLKFLSLALTDTHAELQPLPANRAAWGKLIPVPERSQMAYPNGKVLCSPTTVSMLLAFWAQETKPAVPPGLRSPSLDRDVPEVVDGVYDANWKGTGNWAFNMAYAGSLPGMRAYVARLSDLSEVEDWVASGVPVGLSLCYDRLRGKGPGPNGHLVVCVGFTAEGDPIINDPGTRQNVRKIFPRRNLVYAWAYSRNAAYLVYPLNSAVPTDRFGHWASFTARRHVTFE